MNRDDDDLDSTLDVSYSQLSLRSTPERRGSSSIASRWSRASSVVDPDEYMETSSQTSGRDYLHSPTGEPPRSLSRSSSVSTHSNSSSATVTPRASKQS